MTTHRFSHEIFVPSDIVFDLWTAPEHVAIWFPQLTDWVLSDANPPQDLAYVLDANGGEKLSVHLEGLGSNTRMAVSLTHTGAAVLPTGADQWHAIFQALESYLSSI